MKTVATIACGLVLVLAAHTAATDEPPPFVSVKRSALWVPDLDRAIVFYRDVLGFSIVAVGTLQPKPDSVLLDLFNTDVDRSYRRVLFSSSTDDNALFVMETEDAPEYSAGDQRHSVLVIRTHDLDAVVARAKANGFGIGNSNVDTSVENGREFRETTVFGPGGQAVLVYQLAAKQALVPSYRHSILVSDLDRSLTLYRDILGLTLGRVAESAEDSCSSAFFNIPPGAMERFAYLNGDDDRRNILGIGEVPGIELKLPDAPRGAAWVQSVDDVEDAMDKLQALGLELIAPQEFLNRETGKTGIETGVIDFDGHLIMIYGMKGE